MRLTDDLDLLAPLKHTTNAGDHQRMIVRDQHLERRRSR
jgi:hypothetical protein